MKFTVGTVTDRGLNPKRTANEDRLLALPERGLFVVADGVGGRRGGQIASQTAVDVFEATFAAPATDGILDTVRGAVTECNRRIFDASLAKAELQGMATTLAVLAVNGSQGVIGHVGDSRVYRHEGGTLFRETEDHSEVNEALRAGVITAAMAAHDPRRNVLTRALGAELDVEPDFKTIQLREGARFLLCSDGITRHIKDEELQDLLGADQHPAALCERLKEMCYACGAEDNLTGIIVDLGARQYRAVEVVAQSSAPPVQTGSRIEVEFRPPAEPAETGPAKTAKSPKQVAKDRPAGRFGREFKQIFIGLVVVLAGFAVGRYYEQVYIWITGGAPVSGRADPGVVPSDQSDPELAAARVLFEEKRFEKAREQLIELVRRNPENAGYRFWLGRTDYELKSYSEAIRNLNEAARLDARLPDVYRHLARAYEAIGDRRNMEESLRRVPAR
jgi:serine/threonine protein phosphatase PrpC